MAEAARHALSVDLEDWYHPELVRPHLGEGPRPSHAREALAPLLERLQRHGARATFFVVGELLAPLADLLRDLQGAGHELGCHGWSHRTLWALGPEGLREELARFRQEAARLGLDGVVGFRAPTFSLDGRTAWALSLLAEFGFRYDSSVFPARGPLYGVPGAPLGPYRPSPEDPARPAADGPVWELPPTVCRLGPWRVPVAGGAYLRLLPFAFLRWCLRRVAREGRPLVLYVHPWELWPGTPRADLPPPARWATYGGRGRALGRLERLLEAFSFAPLGEVLGVWSPPGEEEA
ncbi:MAG: polysaccharide deacetylase family protein [Anaerolineae bacterium]|nr:polysaccharide deacetylase family protein [Anaerolineae bacterium]